MKFNWPRATVGTFTGQIQAPSIFLTASLDAIAVSLALSQGWSALAQPVGWIIPIIATLLVATGDRFGGRRLILALAGATAFGMVLIAGGGWAASIGLLPLACGLVGAGWMLACSGVRLGQLVEAYLHRGLGSGRAKAARALRAWFVPGTYSASFGAVAISALLPWELVATVLALVYVGALWPFVRLLRGERRRLAGTATLPARRTELVRPRDLARVLRRHRALRLAAAAASLRQGMVFAYFGGLPVVLAGRGAPPGVIGLVLGLGVLAAFVVYFGPASTTSFERRSGAAPVIALAALQIVTHLAWGGPAVYLLAYVLMGIVVEVSRQHGQAIAGHRAELAVAPRDYYLGLSAVGLFANLGPLAFGVAGRQVALLAEGHWITLLLVTALVAWALESRLATGQTR